MRAYVLSHTKMHGKRFCTCVAAQVNEKWVQRRLMNQSGYSMKYSETPLSEEELFRRWTMGAVVEIGTLITASARSTHPEDQRIDPSTISLPRLVLTDIWKRKVVAAFTFNTIQGLYPMIGLDRYVEEQTLPRSVGYVRNVTIEIYSNGRRANITDTSGHVLQNIPVVGIDMSDRYPARQILRGQTIRLSLANAWDGRSGPGEARRCYIQLSDIVVI